MLKDSMCMIKKLTCASKALKYEVEAKGALIIVDVVVGQPQPQPQLKAQLELEAKEAINWNCCYLQP